MLTLDGMVTMKVPAGTQPDAQLILRGKGIRYVTNPTKRYLSFIETYRELLNLLFSHTEAINTSN